MNESNPPPIKPVRLKFRNWRVACDQCSKANTNKDLVCRKCGERRIKAKVFRKVEEFLTRGFTGVSFVCIGCQSVRPKVTCTGCGAPMRALITEQFAQRWLL